MANFRSAVLTKDGIALLAKAQTGNARIEFTKAATGNGEYGDSEALDSRTALKSQKQTFPINSKSIINDATVYLKFIITNRQDSGNLQAGYYVKEVGIFAKDPDKGEILYSIAVAVIDQWDYLPAYNELMPSTITMEFYTEVANAKEVFIQAGPGIYVLQEDFNQTVNKIYQDMGAGSTLAGDHLISIGRELTEFTWEELSEIAKSGRAAENNIHVGDYKTLMLSDVEQDVAEQYPIRMQVAGINTYAARDFKSSFPAYHIDWISIELYSRNTVRWNEKYNAQSNVDQVADYIKIPYYYSELRSILGRISEDLPEYIKDLIVRKNMFMEEKCDFGRKALEMGITGSKECGTDLLWLPTEFEITGTIACGSKRWSSIGQIQYPLFCNSGLYSRMKRVKNRPGYPSEPWWTMSIADDSESDAVYVTWEGAVDTKHVSMKTKVPICFRL